MYFMEPNTTAENVTQSLCRMHCRHVLLQDKMLAPSLHSLKINYLLWEAIIFILQLIDFRKKSLKYSSERMRRTFR